MQVGFNSFWIPALFSRNNFLGPIFNKPRTTPAPLYDKMHKELFSVAVSVYRSGTRSEPEARTNVRTFLWHTTLSKSLSGIRWWTDRSFRWMTICCTWGRRRRRHQRRQGRGAEPRRVDQHGAQNQRCLPHENLFGHCTNLQCRVGRISWTEDFKHLARKVSHHPQSSLIRISNLRSSCLKIELKDYFKYFICSWHILCWPRSWRSAATSKTWWSTTAPSTRPRISSKSSWTGPQARRNEWRRCLIEE